jgi:hypothetical protein
LRVFGTVDRPAGGQLNHFELPTGRIVEIPIRVKEKRPPSINLLKRVPNVIKNLSKLTWAIRIRG